MSPISRNRVLALLLVCWAVMANTGPVMGADTADKNICAMTDVLVAMKELLVILSGQVRDLRQQVRETCHSSCRGPDDDGDGGLQANQTDFSSQEIDDFLEATNVTFTTITTLGLDNLTTLGIDNFTTTTLDPDIDYDYGDDNETDFQNPFFDGMSDIGGWLASLLPFAPKPTGATNLTIEPDISPIDYDDYDDEPTEAPTAAAAITTTTTTSTTTPVTTKLPYTLPPIPTNCPNPFRLDAGGCYLILHDPRDWKSWGEAHSTCQSYGGGLAAPWRLSQLRQYLSRFYSDAFWVGARFIPTTRSWQWLSGRKVEKSTWKQGQPHKNPGKKCVFLDKWSGYHANNFFCGEKYPYICEYSAV